MKARLTLVGAGPGDPELITVKGLKALKQADAVLYDALASEDLLSSAPQAIKIFVGKRAGKHSYSQDKINALILSLSERYQRIVRLKGGDPTVFGRGYEEVEFALSHDIGVDVIPGISSAVAGPAAVDIPLTRRGINESFWIVSGTTMVDRLAGDIVHAARSSATVVALMGLRKLREIVSCFLKYRGPEEPICLVESCTTTRQRYLTGTLGNILNIHARNPVQSPALIIIGSVVNEQARLSALKQQLRENYHANIA